jgi:hypothetical protein
MRILLYASQDNILYSSHRIWIWDLNAYLNGVGVESEVAIGNFPDLSNFDVVIFGKSDHEIADKFKLENPSKIVGAINSPSFATDLNVDFIIVGSVEEQASLSMYDNVFLFPLIESMYQNNIMHKEHLPLASNDKLTIGFHGNAPHTPRFLNGLNGALERFSKDYPVEFVVITSGSINRSVLPNGVDVSIEPWIQEKVFNRILSFDIGVVPNATISNVHDESSSEGLFSTDYEMRFKNKSNAGRAFVFHQLGIPVVADITPSNFHIMGNPDCGYLVANEEGWYKAFLKLSDFRERRRIADNAKAEFDRLYNPYDWARKLYQNIKEI